MALVRSASFCYGKNWDMSKGEGLVTGRDIRYGMYRKTLAAGREAQLEMHGRQFWRKVGQFARSGQDNTRMKGRNMCVSGTEKR